MKQYVKPSTFAVGVSLQQHVVAASGGPGANFMSDPTITGSRQRNQAGNGVDEE